MQVEVFSESVERSVFILSSFFLAKLFTDFISEDSEPKFMLTQKEEKRYIEVMKSKINENYKKVERWTKKLDIF